MKRTVLNIIFFVIIGSQITSCQTIVKSTLVEDSFIPYLLPLETEKAIYEKIKDLSLENYLGFTFEFNSDGTISIYTDIFKQKFGRDHTLTNRKIFVNDKFYPLVFNLDDTFYAESKGGFPAINVSRVDPKNKRNDIITEEKLSNLEQREKLRAVYKRRHILSHNEPILKIDVKGNLIID